MENGHLNLRKNENEAIPGDVLTKIAETFPGPWGAAFIRDGMMEIFGGEKFSKDDIDGIQTDALDKHVFFGFSKAGPQLPFDLLTIEATSTDVTGKEEDVVLPVLTAFMTGDFHGKTQDEIGQYLAKKVQKIYAHNEQDLEKTIAEVREEDTSMEIMDRVGRGAIELFAENGDVISFAKGLTPGSFPWGYMSDNLGFGVEQPKVEEKKDEPAQTAARRVVRRSGPSVPVAGTQPIKQLNPTGAGAVPGDAHTKGKVHDAASAIKMVRWAPNPKWSANKLRDKYKMLGFKLDEVKGFEDGNVQVYVEADRVLKLRNQIGGTLYEDVPAGATRGVVPTEDAKNGKGEMLKDTEPTVVKPEAAKPVTQVTTAALPVISPEQRSAMLNDPVIKTLDKNSAEIEDPEKWLTAKDKHSTLAQQLGLSNDLLMRLKFDGLVKFAEKHGVKPLAILLVDARIKAAEQENLVKQLTERVTELESKVHVKAVETLKATGTDGAPAPVVKQEQQPVKAAAPARRVVRR